MAPNALSPRANSMRTFPKVIFHLLFAAIILIDYCIALIYSLARENILVERCATSR